MRIESKKTDRLESASVTSLFKFFRCCGSCLLILPTFALSPPPNPVSDLILQRNISSTRSLQPRCSAHRAQSIPLSTRCKMNAVGGARRTTSCPLQRAIHMISGIAVCAVALLSVHTTDAATLGRRAYVGQGAYPARCGAHLCGCSSTGLHRVE